jgi:hypothetical protein
VSDDGEVLLSDEAIAQELSRIIGRPVTTKQANYWGKRGVYRVRKAGHFNVATKTSLREDFQPLKPGIVDN